MLTNLVEKLQYGVSLHLIDGCYLLIARIGFVTMLLSSDTRVAGTVNGETMNSLIESDVVEELPQFPQKLCNFASKCLRGSLVTMTTMLHLVHKR